MQEAKDERASRGECEMDAMTQGDIQAPSNAPKDPMDSAVKESDRSGDDDHTGIDSTNDDAEMHGIGCKKAVFKMPRKRFIDLFHTFNDVNKTPKSVARAVHDHLESPPNLSVVNIQARVYKARKCRNWRRSTLKG